MRKISAFLSELPRSKEWGILGGKNFSFYVIHPRTEVRGILAWFYKNGAVSNRPIRFFSFTEPVPHRLDNRRRYCY